MKLSVIVPVYNVEKFLPRCLDSLLRQGLEVGEYEVICVNDGSPDNSGAILAEYEKKHPEVFRVITQENQGPGSAREAGLQVAQGEYIGFLDADDYLVDGAYRYLLEHFCGGENRPDMVTFKNISVRTGGSTRVASSTPLDGKVIWEGDGAEAYNRERIDLLWLKFYRHAFLKEHNCHFLPIIYFEDEIFNFHVFHARPHIVMTNCNVVRWEKGNASSTMETVDHEYVISQLKALLHITAMMNDYLTGKDTILAPAARRNINNFINHIYKKALSVHLSYQEWRECMGALKKLPIHTMAYKNTAGRWAAWLNNASGRTYVAYLFVRYVIKNAFIKNLILKVVNHS